MDFAAISSGLTAVVENINSALWDSILLVLLCGTGIWFTIRLKAVQVRKFKQGLKAVFGNIRLRGDKAGADGMSSFQSLATAVAAQVGTGNIAGAATAIASGGPGAIFWMWLSAFFGMATIYAEASLAQKYKTTVDGEVTGGPVYYIKARFKGRFGKFLAGFFAVAITLALGFMGNMVQCNSISDSFQNAFGVPGIAVGIVVAAIAAVIFLGGKKRIASVTEKIVPVMAVLYILGSPRRHLCEFSATSATLSRRSSYWPLTRRLWPAAWRASRCARPSVSAWRAASFPTRRAWVHASRACAGKGQAPPATRASWPLWACLSTRSSSSR